MVVLFHMEDDTISVFEPPLENSGLDQGVICPRKEYFFPLKNSLADRRAYRSGDLKLGKDYQIAHYLIHLNDADEYTKVTSINREKLCLAICFSKKVEFLERTFAI